MPICRATLSDAMCRDRHKITHCCVDLSGRLHISLSRALSVEYGVCCGAVWHVVWRVVRRVVRCVTLCGDVFVPVLAPRRGFQLGGLSPSERSHGAPKRHRREDASEVLQGHHAGRGRGRARVRGEGGAHTAGESRAGVEIA